MKKFTLLCSLILAGLAVQAQLSKTEVSNITKGSILLGGSLGYNSSSNSGNENRDLFFQPSLGFAIRDNRVLGFNLGFGGSWVYGVSSTATTYNAGVFYRQYLPLGQNFFFFGQGNASYWHSRGKSENTIQQNRTTQQSISLTAAPGITYAINQRFHLEAGLNSLVNLGYSTQKLQTTSPIVETESITRQFNFNINASPLSNLQIGFRIVLP